MIPRIIILALVIIFTMLQPAFAGPPFLTDDPEPVDYQHWEINAFSTGGHVRGETSGDGAAVEINYGLLPNVQVHITPALAYDKMSGSKTQYGYGDMEVGVKYRFVDPGKDDWWPQVAIYPTLEIPTGDASRGLGTTGEVREYLPLWLQKDFGEWTTYGGGGYWNNPGPGGKNYWFFGWLLQRKITDDLTLGGELFHQTADTIIITKTNNGSTGFNLGGTYDLNENNHLLFSAGRGIESIETTNAFSYYLGFQWTY